MKTALPAAPVSTGAVPAAAQAQLQADQRPAAVAQRQQQAAIDASPRQVAQRRAAAALAPTPRPNATGLPDHLKAGVENLSGHSLDDVQVHYNSAKPAALQAHAYAQGTDIHLAPGQEKHLPHEAWHVAQQKQGRVRPTTQLKGTGLNDDDALEREADHKGRQAAQLRSAVPARVAAPQRAAAAGGTVVQRKVFLLNADQNIYQDTKDTSPLSYIGTMGGDGDKQPLFMAYQEFIQLQGQGLTRWEGTVKDKHQQRGSEPRYHPDSYVPGAKPYEEDYDTFFKQYTAEELINDKKKNEFFGAYKFYTENEQGELQLVNTSSNNVRMMLQARLELAYRNGPLYRNVGGGSRAPKASGKLVIYQNPGLPAASALTKSSLSQVLGIDEADAKHKANYGGVMEQVVTTPEEFMKLHGQAEQQEGHLIDEPRGSFFYKSDVTLPRSKSALFTAAGQNYDEQFSSVADKTAYDALLKSFHSLTPPHNRGWRPGTELSSQNREDGQAKAMHKWNALGAAAFANRFLGAGYPLTQNWEWLHVQGAQIGGETRGGNLVAGTFAANSAMIPFETQIAKWAQHGAQRMSVRFSATGGQYAFASRITLEVAADEHPDLHTIDKGDPLRLDFDPLTTTVIDKFSGKLLAKQREFLLGQKSMLPHQVEEQAERRQQQEALEEDAVMEEWP